MDEIQKPGRARTSRRPEEDTPRADYCTFVRGLGPRPGESALAFEKRLAMLIGTRAYWLAVWRRTGGVRTDAARVAGIPINNVTAELRAVGLDMHLLSDALLEKVQLT